VHDVPRGWLRSWRGKAASLKVHSLTDAQYRFWDGALCLTSRDGFLPPIHHIAFHLRLSVQDTERRLAELVEAGFFDPVRESGGAYLYRAHDWDQWQPAYDHSSARVSAHRKQRSESMKRYKYGHVTLHDRFCNEISLVSVSTSSTSSGPSKKIAESGPSQKLGDADVVENDDSSEVAR
jgi:hypothetical protein